MGKLVILKFGHGSFEEGFPVTLEIREDTKFKNNSIVEQSAKLPPNNLPDYYKKWRETYRLSEARYRQDRLNAPLAQETNFSVVDCQQAADKLSEKFNEWLCSVSFIVLRDTLIQTISKNEEVRILIQAKDEYIQKLPWHLWEFIIRYHPDAEVSLSNLP
jgi:hypothetical protein